MEVSLEAQRIEHEVLGSDCGLLDQIAITHSSRGFATLIDFGDMSTTAFRIPSDWLFKLIDTGIRRELAGTTYNSSEISAETREMHALLESDRVREAMNCGDDERETRKRNHAGDSSNHTTDHGVGDVFTHARERVRV